MYFQAKWKSRIQAKTGVKGKIQATQADCSYLQLILYSAQAASGTILVRNATIAASCQCVGSCMGT